IGFAKMRGVIRQGQGDYLDRRNEIESDLDGHRIPQDSFKWLLKQNFRIGLENLIVQSLQVLGEKKVTDDLNTLKQSGHDRIIGNLLEPGELGGSSVIPIRTLVGVNDIKTHLDEFLCRGFSRAGDCNALVDFVRPLIVPNLTPNKQETELRRERARDSVST